MSENIIRKGITEELLSRDGRFCIDSDTCRYYRGKSVLVTGGGGSIGSELCRSLAGCGVSRLVIFDIYENCAYELYDELSSAYDTEINVEIGSVQDVSCLRALFQKYRFDVIFHAAAHKHVPLMEECASEAVKNNIFGTYNLCCETERAGCEKFILISTDKAVNPRSVMGATKRFCEMIAGSRRDSAVSFSSVRFGNVLGSAGSILPLIEKQIERGGPVRLTDRRMKRYFMTPSEAAGLVMAAGSFGKGGELYVLDMGEQVNMYELVCRLIRSKGLEPEKDVAIEEIGIRPGEKLSEELLYNDRQTKTRHGRIFVENEEQYTREQIEERLCILKGAVATEDNDAVKAALRRTIAEYIG